MHCTIFVLNIEYGRVGWYMYSSVCMCVCRYVILHYWYVMFSSEIDITSSEIPANIIYASTPPTDPTTQPLQPTPPTDLCNQLLQLTAPTDISPTNRSKRLQPIPNHSHTPPTLEDDIILSQINRSILPLVYIHSIGLSLCSHNRPIYW